jgi:hypothetical protein
MQCLAEQCEMVGKTTPKGANDLVAAVEDKRGKKTKNKEKGVEVRLLRHFGTFIIM